MSQSALLSEQFLGSFPLMPESAGPLYVPVYWRTYMRYSEGLKRRELPVENCARVTDYNVNLDTTMSHENKVKEAEFMFRSMFNLEVLPSGRTMWVGGTEASRKFAESQFNCSFVVIDSRKKFTELFHMLLCGSGVGFRVRRADVAQINTLRTGIRLIQDEYKPVASNLREEATNSHSVWAHGDTHAMERSITVGDSKEGWVEALNEYFVELSSGICQNIRLNYDNVRPSGERIKTFGGRAAGPKGLMEMFEQVHGVIERCGGSLRPIDALDICCIIALNVVVGGTRRSSLIALGDPEDQEFINAKVGLYTNPEMRKVHWRNMSNNTVVYESKPDRATLEMLFEKIVTEGEPGFFNLEAARKRRPNAQGLNPCVAIDTWTMTSQGPKQVKDLLGKPFRASVNGKFYKSQGFFKTGHKKIFYLSTKEGFTLSLTEDHKVLTVDNGWVKAGNLVKGDKIQVNRNEYFEWEGRGSRSEGWMLGSMLGDGCLNEHGGILRYWSAPEVAQEALAMVKSSTKTRSDLGLIPHKQNGYKQICSSGLRDLAHGFGMSQEAKTITDLIEQGSSEFYKGFLSGLFDADGSPQGNKTKGQSVRLSQSNETVLRKVQRMLARLGIMSRIYFDRQESGMKKLPDSNREPAPYYCQANHELVISRESMGTFAKLIGFKDPVKQARLEEIVTGKRELYKDRFEATFEALTYLREEDVYDCTVEDVHRFDANGLTIHNCAEIILDDRGVCNLSTVNMFAFVDKSAGRFDWTRLEKAFRLAVRIGLRQTNVELSMPEWSYVQKRDRLTGVSMTGWMDALDALGWSDTGPEALYLLANLNHVCQDESLRYAKQMRVPAPLLVTAVKPEGTLSQLPTVSSGMHRAYAPYFIRRVRVSSIDPVCTALKRIGVPNEPDKSKPDRIVFSFPIKTDAPYAASEESAVGQLKRYLAFQKNYTDHNTSCSLYFAPEEVKDLIDLMLEEWDNIVAIALFPKGEMNYPQKPYEEITAEQYAELVQVMPSHEQMMTLPDIINRLESGEVDEEFEADPSCASGVCPVR